MGCKNMVNCRNVLAVLVLLLCIELILRCFGFCDALLYRESPSYEYIALPDQDRYRFGAHIKTNSFSQRNSEEPDTSRQIILGLGDSVLFGGTMTDQDDLASTLFSLETGMQMLNISAGSWGPDNCAAYLKEKGTFGAKAMVLVCSSHDAYDRMSHVPVVGKFPNYPDRQYKVAIWELLDRYIIPKLAKYWDRTMHRLDPDETVANHVENAVVQPKSPMEYPINDGFGELKAIADSMEIPFLIYLHAEKGELEAGEYNDMGKAILQWAEENNVRCVKGLEDGETPAMYRDGIHLNEDGQKHLAKCLEILLAD
ncbi:hypothetical protein [Palleniella muris]|nr:hypothetical protein [Palleniella muris]